MNIAFLGSKDLGFRCLKLLYNMRRIYNFNIAAVLTNERGEKIKKFCQTHKLNLLNSLNDYLQCKNIDIAISVQYHAILKPKHIKKARLITLNFHMAPLPEYRGCNQFSFAILDQCKTFGVTLHRLDEGVDSGDIILEKRFKIPKGCWVAELHDLASNKMLELFKESMPVILSGKYKLTPQSQLLNKRKCSFHYRKEIEKLKIINLGKSKHEIETQIKATAMPGFEPPYFLLDNKKSILF